jgi:hypothetical protein
MTSTVFYVAFTPSCNKDRDNVFLLGMYDTEAEAERNLIRLVRHRQKFSEGLLERSEVVPASWGDEDEDEDDCDNDESPILRRRAFVFPGLTDTDYTAILGAEFVCLRCLFPPAFWILEADEATLPGHIREQVIRWIP